MVRSRTSLEQKLSEVFELCAEIARLTPPRSDVHQIRQWHHHGQERERMLRFEARRSDGNSVC